MMMRTDRNMDAGAFLDNDENHMSQDWLMLTLEVTSLEVSGLLFRPWAPSQPWCRAVGCCVPRSRRVAYRLVARRRSLRRRPSSVRPLQRSPSPPSSPIRAAWLLRMAELQELMPKPTVSPVAALVVGTEVVPAWEELASDCALLPKVGRIRQPVSVPRVELRNSGD